MCVPRALSAYLSIVMGILSSVADIDVFVQCHFVLDSILLEVSSKSLSSKRRQTIPNRVSPSTI